MTKIIKKAVNKVKTDNERGARQGILEDLFYDFNRNRHQVYVMNFVRGIFFGFGSVLGATVLVAILAWTLSLFVDLPGIGHSIQQVQHSIQNAKKQ